MLRCLSAINLTHCCFTTADLEDSLAEIEFTLGKLSIEFTHLDPMQLHCHKKELGSTLESVYEIAWHYLSHSSKVKPDKRLIFLIADILRRYAQLHFQDNYLVSKHVLSITMNLLLYSIGILSVPINLTPFHSLQEIAQEAAEEHKRSFQGIQETLQLISQEKITSTTVRSSLLSSFMDHRFFVLANTARLLALSYKQTDPSPNNSILTQLFTLSESLLLLIDNACNRKELAHLYFSSWPLFNASLKNDAVALHEKILPHCNTPEMEAKVANKQYMIEFAAGNMEAAQKCIEHALSLGNSHPHSFSPYLLSTIHYNYGMLFLEPQNFDIEKARDFLKKAADFASLSREAGEERLYFATYDEQMAEIECLMGNFQEAKKYVETSLATLALYPKIDNTLEFKNLGINSLINKILEPQTKS
jgi:hypothetical protein